MTACLLAWMLLGCGGTPRPAPVNPAGDPKAAKQTVEPVAEPATATDDAGVVRASATAASREQAYRDAVAGLEAAVYGADSWARSLGLALHDPAVDIVQESPAEGGDVEVTVGLERERVAELLTRIAAQPWQTSLPAALAEPIQASYQVYVERFVCERRRALLGEDCELPDTADLEAHIQAVAGEVELRPVYQDGVPVDAEGRPLRPIRVMAAHVAGDGTRTPLAGVPAVAMQPEGVSALEALQAVSDQDGVVSFAFLPDAQWPQGVRVALDRDTLLGPLASMWPATEVELASRPTGSGRWSAVAIERVQGRRVDDGVLLANLDQALRASGHEGIEAVAADTARAFATASASGRVAMLPDMADQWRGSVDLLVVVDVNSDYASRMGTHRVWYEAHGRAHVYDVWTGKRLATVEETVTAAGVGDRRADRAARTQLAGELAEKLASMGIRPAS